MAALLRVFEPDPERVRSLKEIIGLTGADEKDVRRGLKKLVREGKLERERGRRYRISRVGSQIEGEVKRAEEGLVLITEAADRPLPLSLPKADADVDEGDRVRARIEPSGKRGRVVAKLVEVVSRKTATQIGVFRRIARATFVEPEPRRDAPHPSPVMIPPDQAARLHDGELVELEVVTRRTRTQAATGRVIRVLGSPGDRGTEIQRIFIEHALPARFPDDVEWTAKGFGTAVPAEEISRRRDVRDLALVTIDGEDARDFDDAVYAEPWGKSGHKLYVAIADVSYYVREGSPIDKEALKRGTSTYLTDRAIPMLPEALSNHLCSLVPDADRLCVVAEMRIDGRGRLEGADFYRATMRSKARLTYTRVAKALEGAPDEEIRKLGMVHLERLAKVAERLLERRLERGAIDLDLPEAQVVFDAEGLPVDVLRRPRNVAHRLIEDLMLAANEAVAGYFEERRLPTIFRIHEDPDPERLESFARLCQQLGLPVRLRKKVTPKDVARTLADISEHRVGRALHSLLLRSLAQARYYPENEGHFGLAAERYLHFTSPIRRYPDLMVHRLLNASLEGRQTKWTKANLAPVAEQCSEAERRAALAERASKDLDRALVAANHVGKPFTGVISAVTHFGLFVSIDRPFVDGLIPIAEVGDDYFEADEHGAFLRGKYSGRELHIGMAVEVEIASVNMVRRQVELRLIGQEPIAITGMAHGRLVERRRRKEAASEKEGTRERRGGRRAPARGESTPRKRQGAKKPGGPKPTRGKRGPKPR